MRGPITTAVRRHSDGRTNSFIIISALVIRLSRPAFHRSSWLLTRAPLNTRSKQLPESPPAMLR